MAPARKSGSSRNGLVTLTVSPSKLRNIISPDEAVKEASPVKEEATPKEEEKNTTPKETNGSPTTSATLPATQLNGENVSDSNPATPGASGTPVPPAMAPPAEGANGKKKGTKRSAATANGEPKPRGKPGPKKKPRLEDGTIDPTSTGRGNGASHKLGPKANQGAINAGLRALDRSGKPCRRWARGGFKLKSFTGVVWEVHRWKAPQPPAPEGPKPEGESAGASATSSTKENKEEPQGKSDANSPNVAAVNGTTNGQEVEMQSPAASVPASVPASSPAPVPIAAAS